MRKKRSYFAELGLAGGFEQRGDQTENAISEAVNDGVVWNIEPG